MIFYSKDSRVLLDTEVDDNSYRHRAIMGDHNITFHYSLADHVELPVGAYCVFGGERFTLERPESFKMKHRRNFEYTVTMEGDESKAKKYKFRNTVDGRLKFSLTAKPHEHLQMFVDNMNRRDGGWSIGECIEGTEVMISYNHNYCFEALSMLATELNTEFEFVGKKVSLRKVEYNKNTPLALSYGHGNGFRTGVGRANSGERQPVEILFVQGGSENIDRSTYGNGELLLPKNQTLMFDGQYFETDSQFNINNARKYIVDDKGLSIRRADKQIQTGAEDSFDATEIYPKREGIVTNVVAVNADKNFYDIIDNTIPDSLDFSECQIEGNKLTIIFQSGMLVTRKFEVTYFHKSVNGKQGKRFELTPIEEDGMAMPSDNFVPVVGDKYAVFNCALPSAYIADNVTKTGAEWDMFKVAVRYMYEHEEIQFTFTGELDGIWAKKDWLNIGAKLKLGAYVEFSDTQFQKDGVLVRIVGIKDYINNPHSPEIELSNQTITGGFSSTLNELKGTEVVAEEYHRDSIQFTKRRFRDAKETIDMLEDALLDNFTNSVNPLTVQTMSMLVGDESLQFQFVNNTTNPTPVAHNVVYDPTTKVLSVPSGIIQHLTLGIDSISSSHTANEYKYWALAAFESPTLTDGDKKYYLYAKVSKTAQTGVFYISETAIAMEAVAGYYHLLMGVLNSEFDGERSYASLYGFSEILPGRITTDRLVSASGTSYFDMVNNAMKLGNVLDFNSQGDGKLRLKGTLVQSKSGTESYIGCYRGVWNSVYTYYNGDEVSYTLNGQTSSYRYIKDTPTSGIAPTNASYWQVTAAGAKGDKGDPGDVGDFYEYRYAKNGSTTTAPDIATSALNPAGWTTTVPTVSSLEYLWTTIAKKSGDGTTLLQEWSVPMRITPKDGDKGDKGESPALVFRGAYDDATTYYGNNYRVDAVKYNEAYYVARIDAGTFYGTIPTSATKWSTFGAQFESVATNLLLAEDANIGDWIIKGGKITSQSQIADGIPNAQMDGTNGGIKFVSNVSKYTESGEIETKRQVINISSSKGEVEVRTVDNDTATITSQGISANRAGTDAIVTTTGFHLKGAIVGHGYGKMDKDMWGSNFGIAGVVGISQNFSTNPAPAYGGYFYNLLAAGMILNPLYISGSTSLTKYLSNATSFILSAATAGIQTIYLPSAPYEGQIILFKQLNRGTMRVYPYPGQKLYEDSSEFTYYNIGEGDLLIAVCFNSVSYVSWAVNSIRLLTR